MADSRKRNIAVEVVQEFASFTPGTDPEDGPPGLDYIFLPKWKEYLPGHSKPVEYGPSLWMLPYKAKKHQEHIDAGGHWDPDKAIRYQCVSLVTGEVVSDMRPRRDARSDHDLVSDFVQRHSPELSMQALQVFVLYWRDGLMSARVAELMGIEKKTAERHVERLRKKAREWGDERLPKPPNPGLTPKHASMSAQN